MHRLCTRIRVLADKEANEPSICQTQSTAIFLRKESKFNQTIDNIDM